MSGNPNYFKHAHQFHQQQRKRKFETGSANYSPHPKPHHAHGGGGADHHKKQRMQAMMKVVAGQQQQSHQELLRETRQLPIFFGKAALIQEVAHNPTVIVMSETGSGKTTQLPQYILNQYANKGIICCTQPRRVAAISVAQRVAKEMNTKVGDVVGYTVRFEDSTSPQTKLKYMTDGMLLREALLDPLLKRYSVVILDEAHERSVQTDVLFGVVKKAQQERQRNASNAQKLHPLKIIIMSATLQAEQFEKYFNGARICFLEGRRHPIKVMYTEAVQKDYVNASLVTTFQLHKDQPPGPGILVFLTGQEEITTMAKTMQDIAKHAGEGYNNIQICPLFASLPFAEQMRAFSETPAGYRKIILSTNIAETSVTLPNIKYVVDCGMVKAKDYNPTTGMETLKVRPVSKAQARQRCGRAGRECPGVCYRLYPEDAFKGLDENTVPEIQRCNLRSVVLNLLAMGLPDVVNFDFMSTPSENAIKDALEQLVLLQAVDTAHNQKITEKGKQMSAFPLDPALSRCILAAKENECVEEMVTVLSIFSVDSLTYIPPTERERGHKIMARFAASEGDQVSALSLFREYRKMKANPQWCRDHYIDQKTMKTVRQIRTQLKEMCVKLGFPVTSSRQDEYKGLRKSLCSGLFFNSAERQPDGTYMTLMHKTTVHIHPSSVLFRQKPSFVVFNELVETSKRYMRGLSVVDPMWLIDACPSRFENCKLLPEAVTS